MNDSDYVKPNIDIYLIVDYVYVHIRYCIHIYDFQSPRYVILRTHHTYVLFIYR